MPPSSSSHSYLLRDPEGISTKTTASSGMCLRGMNKQARGRPPDRPRESMPTKAGSARAAPRIVPSPSPRGHRRRMLDQALDAAERLGAREHFVRAAIEAASLTPRTRSSRRSPSSASRRAVTRVRRQARVVAPSTLRVARETRDAVAFAQCAHAQCSVFTPRSTRQQSNGPGTPPSDSAGSDALGHRRSFVAATPPTTSLCPFRYFVVECTTTSAPSSSGRWKYGVMNVLSTTSERAGFLRGVAAPRIPRSSASGSSASRPRPSASVGVIAGQVRDLRRRE